MTYFHTWSRYQQPELDKQGNVKTKKSSGNVEVVETGIDIYRHIKEITEGVKEVYWEGRRFLSPQQLSVGVEYYTYETESSYVSDNLVQGDLNFWGDFKWNLPQRRLPSWSDMTGKFQSYQWVGDSDKDNKVQVFETNLDIGKFLKANDEKRFQMLTNKNDTIIGSKSSDVLDGGNGDDYIFGRGGTDILKGGKGSDTFVFDEYSRDSVIKDFDVKKDKILIDDFYYNKSEVVLKNNNDGLTIGVNDPDSWDGIVTLEGVSSKKGVKIMYGDPGDGLVVF